MARIVPINKPTIVQIPAVSVQKASLFDDDAIVP